jgi:hypothetical protein
MSGHVRLGEDGLAFVAGVTGNDRLLFKVVRTMATNALSVPVLEDRRRRDLGLLSSVTGAAR